MVDILFIFVTGISKKLKEKASIGRGMEASEEKVLFFHFHLASYYVGMFASMERMYSMFVVILLICFVHGSDIRSRKQLFINNDESVVVGRRLLLKKNDTTTEQQPMLNNLKELQRKINLDYDPKKWDVISDGSYSFSRLATRLVTSQFDYLIGELPVFVYDAPTHTDDYLGNRLGNYFEAVTCANMAGLHFVCLTNQTDANKLAQGLPTIIVHPNPAKVIMILP